MTKEGKKQAILEKQFDMAMNGSVEMLKWLGIQICGQSNKPDMMDDELPIGFDVCLIKTKEQEEFEEYREEFLEWKESNQNQQDDAD